MQYIVGTNMSTTVKIAGKIDGLIKSFKLAKINAVNPPPAKVTISNKKKLFASGLVGEGDVRLSHIFQCVTFIGAPQHLPQFL